jgi:serine/threonine protein kinase
MKIKIKKDMGESVRFCVPFESLRPLTKSVENKGYALFTARAYQEGHPENTYFIKFSKLEGISKEKLYNMREAFTKENKFKIRYPYIAYVEGCAECILSVDASEAQKQEINKSTPYELLEGETKIICLFEELVNGEDLKTVYSLHADKPISEEWMFRHMHQLIYGMCNYMSYDRDKLVHRDIRPANIRVTSDKMMVKYIDFDWAHISRSKATSLQSRPVGGTPGYMDPRQAKSDTASKKADPTMDIYSLAMVFLYMMLGEHYIDVCGYSDTWDYLEDEEFLYVLKRSNLKRDGKLVYQEDKYSNLLRIIAKMMTVVEKRYQNPEYLLKDFEAFLREYYGMEKYKEFFQEERVLTSQENESIHYIECFRRCEGKKSRMMLQIANYQVLEIRDMLTKQYPIMMLYMLNHQIYYRPMTEEFEVITGDIQKNILTTEKSQFRINTEVLELTEG